MQSSDLSASARMCAAAIALLALAGLAIQFRASFASEQSVALTAWVMLRYFTVIANLLVVLVFGAIAFGKGDHMASALGGVTLAMVLVGVVYAVLLRGLLELSGGAQVADFLLHTVTTALVPLFWLAFAPKGQLHVRDPLLWSLLPLAYFVYVLVRGSFDGNYAYPFMNVVKLGWPQAMRNAAIIAVVFVMTGYAMLWLDRTMARRHE